MKLIKTIIMTIMMSAPAMANYSATYGKTDNIEIGFDLLWDFVAGLAPYMMYILLALLIAWVLWRLSKMFN